MSKLGLNKILLFYCGITECGFGSLSGNEGTWINHGLCLISAVLKKEGYNTELVDLRRLKDWSALERFVKGEDFDIAGFTVMSVDFNPVTKCIEIIKRLKPAAKVIVGGPHVSISPEELTSNKNIDYVFIGEAEKSIVPLIARIRNNEVQDKVVYGERPDLDELPFADRELFSLPEEPFVPFLKGPFVTLIAGRGCVYNCNYCQPAERIIFGSGVRRRSVENIISELELLRNKQNFNSMMIHDDCLTEDKAWIMEFCDKYTKNGFNQPFVCQSRPDLIVKNIKMVKHLKKAGLAMFIIGFESGSQRMLDFLQKGTTVRQNIQAAEICHRFRIKIWANYMLGLPGETKEEQRMTVDMIKKIRPYHCSPAYYTPHPGSKLFDYCQENNLSLIKNHDDYRRSTYEPKIKGIDYDYLKGLLYESISYEEGGKIKGVGRLLLNRIKSFLNANKQPAGTK